MRRTFLPLCSLVALIALADAGSAETPPPRGLAPIAQRAVDRGFPALVLLVDNGRGRVGTAACGYSDLGRPRPARPDDAYHLASIGKLFTAVATLQLADRGKIDLDSPVVELLGSDVLAGIPHAEKITVRQLLDHSSGLYAFNNNLDYLQTLIGSRAADNVTWHPDDLVALARKPGNKPLGAPGTGHYYSDTNYILLGRIVEQVAGTSFKQHIADTIFKPLGMRHSWFYGDRHRQTGPTYLARGHLVMSDELRNVLTVDPHLPRLANGMVDTTWAGERLDASAGIVSTAYDLHKFARALFDGRLLSPASQKWLMSVAEGVEKLEPGKDRQAVLRAFNMPYGVSITANGDGPNVNTVLAFDPATKAIVIAFTNVFGRWDENDIIRETVVREALAIAAAGRLSEETWEMCRKPA